MIDLHVHILPGVDDGSPDMESSIEMAELAAEGGTEILVATPHSNQKGNFENYYTDELKQKFHELNKTIKEEQIPLTILEGMEIFCSEGMQERILDGTLIGINHSDYYLVEFPFDADPYWIGDRLEEILDLDKIPLIAHPERYFCVQDYPILVYEWLRMGCRTQMNKGSANGRFGRHTERAAHILLEHDLISCVSSDAHSYFVRTPYMEDVQRYFLDVLGDEKTYYLMHHNAERIIHNHNIPLHGRLPEKKKRFFL